MILRPPFGPTPGRVQAHLRLIATTDLHMHLRPWDYVADRPRKGTGLLAAAPLIRALRDEVPCALLLDVGDLLQGNALADHLAADESSAQHALIAAMNLMGYAAGTLGNHDFDYGLAYLDRTLAQAQFPVVSANLRRPDGTGYRPPWALIRTRATDAQGTGWPLTVGVIGFAPTQTLQWARHHVAGLLVAQDIVDAAAEQVPLLRAAGAEVVVALCHSGMAEAEALPGMENAAIPLAAVPGIDVMLMGHTHAVFPGPGHPASPAVDPVAGRLHGKPAVQAGYQGSHVGVVDLLIARDAAGWRPVADSVAVLPAQFPALPQGRRAAADTALVRATAKAHQATLAAARQVVGVTQTPITSYFSQVAPDAGLQLLADAQRAAALPALAQTQWAGLPLISAVAPNRVGGPGGPDNYLNAAAGPLAARHLGALSPFPNTLCLLALTGADIADWLERAVSGFARIIPGRQDQPLIDPAFPGYVFDLLDGLTYTVDPSAPARTDVAGRVIAPGAQRISDLRLDGRALRPDERLIVVTNAYRAGGGGGFAAATVGRIIVEVPLTGQDAMRRHLAMAGPDAGRDAGRNAGSKAGSKAGRNAGRNAGPNTGPNAGPNTGTVNPARPTWQFAPLPGTAAWFDTSPAAAAHLPLPGRNVTDAGCAPNGFRRFRLWL